MEDARDLVGRTALVKLVSNEGLGFIDAPEDGPFFCKVVAVDEIGLWIENNRFVTVEIRDSRGRFIPEEKQEPVTHTVSILLPWRLVHTVVRFEDPDIGKVAADIIGMNGEAAGRIGFRTREAPGRRS